ncbi:PREDICTED: MATH domain and coiled-coil domain-containing protein At2g42480-like [Camelina sativa]|uniref:MATH domain and coiled-coil domain-containing protein At2g42480-like n=1 Tax=Camelina sativa TaxID=90675 RepID=A0ABM1RSJ0_CAMSA|nr:PREDICTED: MATH domain and coiled-coil domain-containing protein At2g42480-like [Camelina sativa]
MWNQKPCFRCEIDNFSEKEALITSQVFVSGGCKWFLNVHPKGDRVFKFNEYLSLYLNVANPKSLRNGWKRTANFYFVLHNQSDKEFYRSPIGGQESTEFCAETPSWGWPYSLARSKPQEKGYLENDRLIIEIYINNVDALDGEGEDVSLEKDETVENNGFHVFASQVTPVTKIFKEHPDIAEHLKVKNQVVKTVYMNVLRNAHSELSELEEVGFKIDWLKLKLAEVSLKGKKEITDVIQQFREPKVEEVSLGTKKSDDDDGSRVQQLEERLKNLELMELDFKLDCMNSKLEEVSLEKKKADADWYRVQQLEESVKSLVIMVSDLKVELDKKTTKYSTDGFLLVDEVA